MEAFGRWWPADCGTSQREKVRLKAAQMFEHGIKSARLHRAAAANVTLTWDNLPSHKSKAMTAWLATQASWLVAGRLPGYAHDLNPIEMVWGNVKAVELANLCPDTIEEARAAAEVGLKRVSSGSELCFAFLAHTGLSL
jgi:transposase